MRDYPIGTFLFWFVDKKKINDFEFYEFLDKYHEKNSRHNKKASLSDDDSIIALLDGQQRMTSLFLALCGSYSDKKKHARRNDMSSYQEKYLYLNLLNKSPEIEKEYDFRFLTDDEAKSIQGYWFKCSEIMFLDDMSKVSMYLMKNKLMDSSQHAESESEFAINVLNKFFNVIHQKETINFFLEKGEELDKVLQIFIRINSGGTKLSYSDLLLSIATAQWDQRDAREVIHEFVDEINNIGDGFNFNKDLVLKACLVLPGFSDVKFKVDNFTKANMIKIEECWDQISNSLRKAIQLVSSFGFNRDNLLATNAIIPIAYFIYKNQFSDSILSSSAREEDRKLIREWLARVLLKGVFGGQPDSIYPVIRKIIDENLGSFPLDKIIEKYRGERKSIIFNDDEIETLLDLQYGKAKTYCVLSLLYPSLNYSIKYHQDHIHPKSKFNSKYLSSLGISIEDIEIYLKRVNEVANLQLIEPTQNIEKSDIPFKEWLGLRFPSADERKIHLSQNHINTNASLDFTDFIHFVDERRYTIKNILLNRLGKK
tara:strand:- start:62 stop:1681 length:1620 start_codon:yes stop_codon:yes gene_type:complete